MAVETSGIVRMRGEDGRGTSVRVIAGEGRLSLLAQNRLVGDWAVGDLGISVLHDEFVIRAEGEVMILRADHDAELADELGVMAASPRMARKIAALHNPEEPDPEPIVDAVAEPNRNALAIVFALGGVLVLLGGFVLRIAPDSAASLAAASSIEQQGRGGSEFWFAFVIGGGMLVALAYVMSIGIRGVRVGSLVLLSAVIVLFGWVVSSAATNASYLTAYGFIAGGLVVAVTVLFGGGLRS